MRIILSTAVLRKWRLSKLDVKLAFFLTGDAERDVYVVSFHKSGDRGRYVWLLLTAAYGMSNAIDKSQVLIDRILMDFEICKAPVMPQLFLVTCDQRPVAIVAKIVDELLLSERKNGTKPLIAAIAAKAELGTIAHGPGHLRYFRLHMH